MKCEIWNVRYEMWDIKCEIWNANKDEVWGMFGPKYAQKSFNP